MKYIVILGDGMADRPVAMLNNKTPLELAKKPCIDYLAAHGECGVVQTIPKGMSPGSDVANLSVMGYAPEAYYSGRSPLEAISMGIDLLPTDIAIRCNLVTLSSDEKIYENKSMIDYSAGDISTAEAAELIAAVQAELGDEVFAFYNGVSYRHCLIEHNGAVYSGLTPPHDISDKPIFEHLPKQPKLLALMKRSYEILSNHPINLERVSNGKRPANSIWLWGAGSKPTLPPFKELYGLNGAVISAVDLLKGLGKASGMRVINVDGATGRLDTNFRGKADACLDALDDGCDYVYLHIEAPDECGHQGEIKNKVTAIELIDSQIVGYLLEKLKGQDFSMLVCPDHATPLELKTHTSEPVPYIIYRSNTVVLGIDSYNEKSCVGTGNKYDSGVALAQSFLSAHNNSLDNELTAEDFFMEDLTPTANGQDADATANVQEIVMQDSISPIAAQMDTPAQNADFILPEVDKIESETLSEDETLPSADEVDTESTEIVTKTKKSKSEKTKTATPAAQKKKKTIIAIVLSVLIFVIIAVVSIVTPILVLNKDKIFIKDAADFGNVNKGNYYVLEKDVIVEGDLNISNPYSIDLNKHNLVVNGTLSFTHNQADKTLNIGTKKGKEYVNGGSISATKMNVECAGKIVSNAVVSVGEMRLTTIESTYSNGVSISSKLVIVGGKHNFNTSLSFSDGATVSVIDANMFVNADGKASYNVQNSSIELREETNPVAITLDELSNAKIFGKVIGDVIGGNTVIMTENSGANIVGGMKTLWVGRDNQNIAFIDVPDANINYIVVLNAPIDINIDRTAEGKIIVTLTKVNHAARYAVYVNDNEPRYIADNSSSSAVVTCDITDLASAAGTHNIKVQALGAEGIDQDLIVPSPIIKAIYTHEVKLDTPSGLNISKEDGKVFLTFNKVNFADEYLIIINGKQIVYREIENLKIDITEHVQNVGAYSIRIQARSAKNAALVSSDVTMTSYVSTRPHDGTITVEQKIEEGKIILNWNGLESATRYTITIKSTDGTIIKSIKLHNLTYTLTAEELPSGSIVTVRADALGYYQDSAESLEIVIA